MIFAIKDFKILFIFSHIPHNLKNNQFFVIFSFTFLSLLSTLHIDHFFMCRNFREKESEREIERDTRHVRTDENL